MFRCLAVALLFACIPAYATPVSVVAVGVLSSYDDSWGDTWRLLPFPWPAPFTTFTLTFTYDSETPDVDGDPGLGIYSGAISAISLTIGDQMIATWPDNRLAMVNNYGTSPSTDYWIATTYVDTPLTDERIDLALIDSQGTALSSDAIVPPSWSYQNNPWDSGKISYLIQQRATVSDPWVIVASVYADVVSITVVPLPLDSDADGIADILDNCTLVANPTQLDADHDGYGNACDGDLNNSGLITVADNTILRSRLNQSASSSPAAAAADLNGSGLVTTADDTLMRSRLNRAPGPSGLACAGTIPCPPP